MRLERPRSLFWSLTASIVGVLLLTAILQVIFAFAVVEPIVRARLNSQAKELADTVALELERTLDDGDPRDLGLVLRRYQRVVEGVILVYEPIHGPPLHPGLRGRRMRDPGAGRGGPPPRLEDLPILATQTVAPGGKYVGQVNVLRARPGLALRQWLPLRWMLLFPVSLVAAALGGMWIFARLHERIRKLQDHALAVGKGDLEARITDPGDDELGQLGQQLNRMTDNLASARARLDAMETERKRLLADITHELSTPLTSVRGYAETLLDDVVEVDAERRTRFLEEIVRASERMGLLMDDLVDLTKLEGGAGQLDLELLDLTALVRNSLEQYKTRFRDAGLALTYTGATDAALVVADGRRLEQVVDNLLANALLHVPGGGRVEAEVMHVDGTAVLEVRDDGPGFGDEALPHVFERFYRAEASRTIPGSGLGLAIVREIVVRHGGQVEASNRPSGGACLSIRIPLNT